MLASCAVPKLYTLHRYQTVPDTQWLPPAIADHFPHKRQDSHTHWFYVRNGGPSAGATPARFAEVSQQLRSALIAEEMWKRRAAAAEEGQPMGSPRATQLAEESLSDRLSQIPETGDSAAQLAEITMQLVTAELDAEKYRQRFEAAESA